MDIFLKIKAGKISTAALGATFGATGVNVRKLIEEINQKTRNDIGLRVLFRVEIDTLTRTHVLHFIEQPITYKLQKLGKKYMTNSELIDFIEQNFNPDKYDSPAKMLSQVKGTCKSMNIIVNE